MTNKNLTLLLLVKGRHEFTERWLKYMLENNFSYPIIIADGENDGVTKKLINKINFSKKLDISFFQYDTRAGYTKYYLMKNDALHKISTKYVMLCDNDDYVLEYGINHLINFLEKNPEYISASGKILNFGLDNFSYNTYGNRFTMMSPCSYYRIEEPLDNWEKQINSVFTQFQPNFYNVFLTKSYQIISDELVEINCTDLVMNEFYVQLRAPTLGKNKVMTSVLHYIRQRGSSSISNNYIFSDDLLKKNIQNDCKNIANKISEIIFLNCKNSKEDLIKIIYQSFSSYLTNFLAHTHLRYRFPKLYKIKLRLKYYENKYLYIFTSVFKERVILKRIFKDIHFNDKDNYKKILMSIKKSMIIS